MTMAAALLAPRPVLLSAKGSSSHLVRQQQRARSSSSQASSTPPKATMAGDCSSVLGVTSSTFSQHHHRHQQRRKIPLVGLGREVGGSGLHLVAGSTTSSSSSFATAAPRVHPRRRSTTSSATGTSGSSSSSSYSSPSPEEEANNQHQQQHQPEVVGDELVLVVGGTGRVGRRIVRRLTALGVRVRVLTRDPASPAALELLASCNGGGGGGGGGGGDGELLELVRGDVTETTGGAGGGEGPGDGKEPELDDDNLREAVRGCTQVIACFGAQRISKITDVFTKPEAETTGDPRHPAAVNYRGVARLAAAAAEVGTVRRFVRVTGMSVGYPPANIIAVLLNTVLSMTIRWQLRGEMAVRSSGVDYTVVRPGSLSDDPRPAGSVVRRARIEPA